MDYSGKKFYIVLSEPTRHQSAKIPDLIRIPSNQRYKLTLQYRVGFNEVGRTWKVKVEEVPNPNKSTGRVLMFTKGWSKLYNKLVLEWGDVLFFEMVDEKTINFTPFGQNGAPKGYICDDDANETSDDVFSADHVDNDSDVIVLDDSDDEEEVMISDDSSDDEENLGKSVLLTNNMRSRLSFPKIFCEISGLSQEEVITLIDESGKRWPCKLIRGNARTPKIGTDPGVRYYFTTGWKEFYTKWDLDSAERVFFHKDITNDADEVQITVIYPSSSTSGSD